MVVGATECSPSFLCSQCCRLAVGQGQDIPTAGHCPQGVDRVILETTVNSKHFLWTSSVEQCVQGRSYETRPLLGDLQQKFTFKTLCK